MNKIKWIKYDGRDISFGFATAADADVFLRTQSSDHNWLEQWTLSYTQFGDVAATTNKWFNFKFKD